MFIDTKGLRIFVYQEAIDMRSGFDRLLHFVRDRMKNNINQGHLYLFLGKNRKRAKAIFFDGTGLVLIAKRIEQGRFMARAELGDITEITNLELKQIFNGGLIVRPRVERSFFTESAKTTSLPAGITQILKNHGSREQQSHAPHPGQ
jgi:transposase